MQTILKSHIPQSHGSRLTNTVCNTIVVESSYNKKRKGRREEERRKERKIEENKT